MPTAILPKEGVVASSPVALTITLASLASSTSGVGRQSTLVDNTTTRYKRIWFAPKIKLGTSPSANTTILFYLIRNDLNNVETDGAGASDAGLTVKNAWCIATLSTGGSPSTGDVLQEVFYFDDPGPKWGIAVVQGTGAGLDTTAGNHTIEWWGEYPEIQA